jgi:probable HAF family extracellular repeat protein
MAFITGLQPRRGLRLAVAGAVVFTALTAATAAASTPAPSATPGFLLERGRYTTLEVPGATVETGAGGINNRGQIVGGARGGGRPDRGFLRDARGRYSTFRYPGSRSTLAQKINDRGQITGYYSNTADDPRVDPTAFLLDRGRYTRIAASGAVTTTAVGINNRGQVVGQYQDAEGSFHGYVWERGRFRTIDAPGAVGTSLFDVNDRGQMVGARLEPDGTFRGFVLDRGRFTSFAAPGAALTVPGDINNRGQIVGFTAIDPATETAHGFLLARGVGGPFTPVSVPGASSTLAFGLNDRGQVTGTYNNPNAAPSPPPATAPPTGRMA